MVSISSIDSNAICQDTEHVRLVQTFGGANLCMSLDEVCGESWDCIAAISANMRSFSSSMSFVDTKLAPLLCSPTYIHRNCTEYKYTY